MPIIYDIDIASGRPFSDDKHMITWNSLPKYLRALIQKWFLIVFLLLDIVAVLVQPFFSYQIPLWVYLAMFAAVFVYASASVYADMQVELARLQERYTLDVAALQDKIKEFENRQPRLDLSFVGENDERVKRLTLYVSDVPAKPNLDGLVEQEAAQLQMPNIDRGKSSLAAAISQAAFQRRKSNEEYQKDSESYLKRYREYLINLHNHQVATARFRTVKFSIDNSGRAPAKDIVTLIHFPDQFIFPTDREILKLRDDLTAPRPPHRPELYVSILPDYSILSPHSYLPPSPTIPTDFSTPPVRGPFIRPKNSTEVEFEIDDLLHNFSVDLDEVEFIVSKDAIGNIWELSYEIHEANLPKPIRGSLLLEVRLDTASQE